MDHLYGTISESMSNDTTASIIRFFRDEIDAEAGNGFPRLSRIPSSHTSAHLDHYRSLGAEAQQGYRDCCATVACVVYGCIVGTEQIDHTKHPSFREWCYRDWTKPRHTVGHYRAMVQDYKIALTRGVSPGITKEAFEMAEAIRSVKAKELRKYVRAALAPLGCYRVERFGESEYSCRDQGKEFVVHVDYGSRLGQLRYGVSLPEVANGRGIGGLCFERSLGFGNGDWDFIVEENVDEVMATFVDVVRYSAQLPERMRQAVGSRG